MTRDLAAKIIAIAILTCLAWPLSGSKPAEAEPSATAEKTLEPVVDDLPIDVIVERSLRRHQFGLSLTKKGECAGERFCTYVFVEEAQWKPLPGKKLTLRVAFDGGSDELHGKIAQTANLWTAESSAVAFDFGCKAPTWTNCNRWSAGSTGSAKPNTLPARNALTKPPLAADIRISFNGPGVWSLMGRESSMRKGQPTMNFQGFLDLPAKDLETWSGSYNEWMVLHEFGHALGFAHELIHPACQDALFWEGDATYDEYKGGIASRPVVNGTLRKWLKIDTAGNHPGLLRFYSALYGWSEPQIRAQFDRKAFLTKVSADIGTPVKDTKHDATPNRTSVMMYWTTNAVWKPAAQGSAQADCVLARDEIHPTLTSLDREMMNRAYP